MKKLDVEIEVIKCKIREEDLQEEFKEKLENKLNSVCESKEYATIEDIKNKKSFINKPYYCYKAAAVFICFVMFSSCAFAGGVGDWLKDMFSNVSEDMEIAYENGDIKEVNTEYQTYDGVSVKVDYVSLKDDQLYVTFNVTTEEEYNIIKINELVIEDEQGKVIFDINNKEAKDFQSRTKGISNKNKLIFFVISGSEGEFNTTNNVNIKVNNISVGNKNNMKDSSYGDWNFEIDLN